MLSHPSTIPPWRSTRPTRRVSELLAHIDLKGPKIPFNAVKLLLELYARWGFSGVLMEYEHRLPTLTLAVECALLSQQLVFLLEESRWWNATRQEVPPGIGEELRERRHGIEQRIDRLTPKVRRYYVTWVGEKDSFGCWWEGLFAMDRKLAEIGVDAIRPDHE